MLLTVFKQTSWFNFDQSYLLFLNAKQDITDISGFLLPPIIYAKLDVCCPFRLHFSYVGMFLDLSHYFGKYHFYHNRKNDSQIYNRDMYPQ